jgi:predicted  nucleic acid-binding Zn-ribbon protein
MSTVVQLLGLQEVDLALNAARGALSEARSLLGNTDELEEAREEAGRRSQELSDAERAFKEREDEANDLAEKIAPLEKKLYQGTILNPKELDDLQRDIESLKRRRSQLDDQAIEAMDALEEAQRLQHETQERLDAMEQDHAAGQTVLRQRIAALEAEISELEGERAEHANDVEPPLLDLYDRIAATRQRAVAKVEGGACQGCRLSLPSSLIQRARGGNNIVQCSSCERILLVS